MTTLADVPIDRHAWGSITSMLMERSGGKATDASTNITSVINIGAGQRRIATVSTVGGDCQANAAIYRACAPKTVVRLRDARRRHLVTDPSLHPQNREGGSFHKYRNANYGNQEEEDVIENFSKLGYTVA